MEIILTSAYIVFFLFLISKLAFFKVDELSKKMIAAIFVLKISSGFVMFLLYTYYYTDRNTADIFKYFDDGKVILAVLFENPSHYLQLIFGINTEASHLQGYLENTNHWFKPNEKNVYNDTRTIIRFNAIVGLFSLGYYQVHNVVINFLSLAGLLAIYKAFLPFLRDKSMELAVGVFLIPSVVFWGSGVLKEGILILGLGLTIFHGFKLVGDVKNWKNLAWLIVGVFLIALSKLYVLFALIPAYLGYILVAKTSTKFLVAKYVAVLSMFLVFGLILGKLHPEKDFLLRIDQKQRDFIGLADSLQPGSLLKLNRLEPTIASFAVNGPAALRNVALRPHIFEATSAIVLLAAIENTVMLLMLVMCMFFFKFNRTNTNLLLFCLTYVLLLYLLIGYTTPVMGAIVRYKAPALPFLFIALLLIFDKEKFTRRIGF